MTDETTQTNLNTPKPASIDPDFEAYKKDKAAAADEKAKQDKQAADAEKPEITELRSALTDAIQHDNPHTRSHRIWLALAATLPAAPKPAKPEVKKK